MQSAILENLRTKTIKNFQTILTIRNGSTATEPFRFREASKEECADRNLKGFDEVLKACRDEGITEAALVVHGGTIMNIMEAYALPKKAFMSGMSETAAAIWSSWSFRTGMTQNDILLRSLPLQISNCKRNHALSQAILLFMSSMHRFGGLLYFPMSNLFGMLGIGIGFNDNMVCDAEIYYSTVFIRKIW